MDAFTPARLPCAWNKAGKYFWHSEHSGRVFQVSASAAVPTVPAGACTTPQQCTGGPAPSQRGREQSRAAISLHTQLQLCFGAFFHSLVTDKTLPKQLIYQSPVSCCCQCTCQRVLGRPGASPAPLLLFHWDEAFFFKFHMLQAMLSALLFCNGAFNPLISGLGNNADSNDNRPHLFHDMSSCPWVTAGVFHKATVSPLAPGKDFC